MFLAKVKIVAGVVLMAAALAAGGIAYRVEHVQAAPPAPPKIDRPVSELEALRKENELLKLNLQVVLEKVRAQEEELRALRKQGETKTKAPPPKTGEAKSDSRDPATYLRRWKQHMDRGEVLSFATKVQMSGPQSKTSLQGSFRIGGPGDFCLDLREENGKEAALRLLGARGDIYQWVHKEAPADWSDTLPHLLPLLRLLADPRPAGRDYALRVMKFDEHYVYFDIMSRVEPDRAGHWQGRMVLDRHTGLPRQIWGKAKELAIAWELLDGKAEGKAAAKEFAVPDGRWDKVLVP